MNELLRVQSLISPADRALDEQRGIEVAGKGYCDGDDCRDEDLEATNRHLRLTIEKLERLVYLDDLTGLANRRFFNAALEAEIRRAVRERTALTLLLCDIDRFKRHNDTFGHRGGDALLRLLGSVIQRYCRRAGDCAARYGGEEFALILPQLKRDDAWALAEDLRQTVSELTIRHSGTNRLQRVTMSIGATTFESDEVCASGTLIDIADAALYQAKNCGRNRTEFHSFEVKAGDARGRKSGR